jgi:hypothetical protein
MRMTKLIAAVPWHRTPASGTQIFINYRSDNSGWPVNIDRALTARFGPRRIFRASRSIEPSEDFHDRIMAALDDAEVLIAVIGTGWLDARRLGSGDDWVRREIAYALRRGIPVLPVLVDGAVLPASDALPDDIAGLARRQYFRLDRRTADRDLASLGDQVAVLAPDLVPRRPGQRRLQWSGAAAVIVLAAAAMSWEVPGGLVRGVQPGRPTSSRSEQASHRPRWISLFAPEGDHPDSSLQISGAGWPALRPVEIRFLIQNRWVVVGFPAADDSGQFIFWVYPENGIGDLHSLPPGNYAIVAEETADPHIRSLGSYTVVPSNARIRDQR